MTVQVRSGVWALAGVGVWGERRRPGGITGHESGCTACAPGAGDWCTGSPGTGYGPQGSAVPRGPPPSLWGGPWAWRAMQEEMMLHNGSSRCQVSPVSQESGRCGDRRGASVAGDPEGFLLQPRGSRHFSGAAAAPAAWIIWKLAPCECVARGRI